MEDWKIKIAVLWIVYESAAIAAFIVEQFIPGFMEEAQAIVTPELLLVMAIVWLIAPVMAFLSLTLKDLVNRWVNIIVGIVFAGLALIPVIDYLARQSAYYAGRILTGIVQFVITALIVWYAWKSKQKA